MAIEYFIGGVREDEFKRLQALPRRPLTREDIPREEISDRLLKDLFFVTDEGHDRTYIFDDLGHHVGDIVDGAAHWVTG